MNKFIIIIFVCMGFSMTNAQVGIETTTVRDGGILDFPATATKGILLPKNSDTSNSGTEPGSLAFDVATQTVVYYSDKNVNGATEGWIALTNATTGVASDLNNAGAGTESGVGVVITDITNHTGAPVGVLELKSNNKALILPAVADLNSLPVAQPGMICYVQEIKSFAIFNGDKWAFWK